MLIVSWLTILIVFIGIFVALMLCWKRHAYLSLALGILNFVVFVVQLIFFPNELLRVSSIAVFGYNEKGELVLFISEIVKMWQETGFRPIIMLGEGAQYWYTIVTSMFVHSGLLHIIGNTIFLILFGVPFEDRVGWKRFALIYFGSGILGMLVKGLLDIGLVGIWDFNPYVTNIGASVAIAGIMGGFLVLYPKDRILAPIGFFFMRAPVYLAVMIFFGYETFVAFSNPNDNISHFGHMFGLLMGLILAPIVMRGAKAESEAVRKKELDLSNLLPLATTPKLKDIYDKIVHEDEPDVRDAWLEKFVETTQCPGCNANLKLNKRTGAVKCEAGCGFEVRL